MSNKQKLNYAELIKALHTKLDSELKQRDKVIDDLKQTVEVQAQELIELKKSAIDDDRVTDIISNTSTVRDIVAEMTQDNVTEDDVINIGFLRPDDLSDIKSALNDLRDATGDHAHMNTVSELVAEVNERIDDAVRRSQSNADTGERLENMITAIDGRITELYEFTAGMEDVHAGIRGEITENCDDVLKRLNALRDALQIEIKSQIENVNERIAEETNQTRDEIQDAVTRTGTDFRNLVDEKFSEAVEQFSEFATNADNDVETRTGQRFDELSNRIETLSGTVCSLPKELIIDSSGDLIGVDRTGEVKNIGRVAVGISDAVIREGRVKLTLNDGRVIDAGNVSELKSQKTKGETKKARFEKWFNDNGKPDNIDAKKLADDFDVAIQSVYRWKRELLADDDKTASKSST